MYLPMRNMEKAHVDKNGAAVRRALLHFAVLLRHRKQHMFNTCVNYCNDCNLRYTL